VVTIAADPAVYGPGADWFAAGVYESPLPEVPAPEPDPDAPEPTPPIPDPVAPWLPVAASMPPIISVVIGRAITREVIGVLDTAVVGDWSEDVELLAGSAADITCSTFDPLLERMAESSFMGADGLPKHRWNPRGYICWIYRDLSPVWTGAFFAPVQVGENVLRLPAQGPQEQFAARILGRAQQSDLLRGRGSFERYSTKAQMVADGWVVPPGVALQIVNGDGVRGNRCIRVFGDGWVRSPYAMTMGADGYGRVVDGQVFAKFSESIPDQTPVVMCKTQRLGASAPANDIYTLDNLGVRPNDERGWTRDPITCAARMEPTVSAHGSWLELRSFPGVWTYYDLAEMRLSVQTGFPPGSTRDLADYVVRIHRDLVARSLGGHPTGLLTRIVSRTGVQTSQRWSHAARTPARDVLAAVLEADGGPECRITAGWNLEVHARLGRDRDDIAITDDVVVAPAWTVDPGGQVDDFIVDTGRGSGVNWLASIVSQPARTDRFRQVSFVQGPTDRSLNEIDRWARAHARAAATRPVTAEVQTTWAFADQVAVGDRIWATLTEGDLGESRRVRVLRKRYEPDTLLCTLSLGAVDA
jgi:hypothetical protein